MKPWNLSKKNKVVDSEKQTIKISSDLFAYFLKSWRRPRLGIFQKQASDIAEIRKSTKHVLGWQRLLDMCGAQCVWYPV